MASAQCRASSSSHDDRDLVDSPEMIDRSCSDTTHRGILKPYAHNFGAKCSSDNGMSGLMEDCAATGFKIEFDAHIRAYSGSHIHTKTDRAFRTIPSMG
jgi:hypothetical protein